MNKQTKIKYHTLFSIVGILLFCSSLLAQPGQNRNHPPRLPDSEQIVEMVEELASTLSLDDEQKSELSKLYFAHFAEAKELMEKHKGDRENHRQAMDALKKEFDAQIQALLNDEQKEKYIKFSISRGPNSGHQRQNQK